ncbi:hypothetical protein NE237_032865 [Protea cynaroides]|uniref:Uncharacterized protein n=1 Tax=Protea cynaroides TaxID=273540 RepID=A0A9Q0L3U0_9MAGN|nr:hypothetical protein NE237_032865 [Protea cynaroides]
MATGGGKAYARGSGGAARVQIGSSLDGVHTGSYRFIAGTWSNVGRIGMSGHHGSGYGFQSVAMSVHQPISDGKETVDSYERNLVDLGKFLVFPTGGLGDALNGNQTENNIMENRDAYGRSFGHKPENCPAVRYETTKQNNQPTSVNEGVRANEGFHTEVLNKLVDRWANAVDEPSEANLDMVLVSNEEMAQNTETPVRTVLSFLGGSTMLGGLGQIEVYFDDVATVDAVLIEGGGEFNNFGKCPPR